jgi:L-amino acid N-acyltransferase YncA
MFGPKAKARAVRPTVSGHAGPNRDAPLGMRFELADSTVQQPRRFRSRKTVRTRTAGARAKATTPSPSETHLSGWTAYPKQNFNVILVSLKCENRMTFTTSTFPFTSEFRGQQVTLRRMCASDKELFRSFIRSLPPKDNYYLFLDVKSDQAIDRWAQEVASGLTLGVVALDVEGRMIGYCSVDTNELPWLRHTGEIRMSVALDYRGFGIGRVLANEVFAMARAVGLEKIWSRMAAGQMASQNVFESLGFRAEAVLSDFVKNEDGLTEDLVMMSYDGGEPWGL